MNSNVKYLKKTIAIYHRSTTSPTKYCQQEKLSHNWNDLTKVELCRLLQRFYTGARKQNGDLYKLNPFKSLRLWTTVILLEVIKVDIIMTLPVMQMLCGITLQKA